MGAVGGKVGLAVRAATGKGEGLYDGALLGSLVGGKVGLAVRAATGKGEGS